MSQSYSISQEPHCSFFYFAGQNTTYCNWFPQKPKEVIYALPDTFIQFMLKLYMSSLTSEFMYLHLLFLNPKNKCVDLLSITQAQADILFFKESK